MDNSSVLEEVQEVENRTGELLEVMKEAQEVEKSADLDKKPF